MNEFVHDFVRDVRPDLKPYVDGIDKSKVVMGGSLLGFLQGAQAQTDQTFWGTTIFLYPSQMNEDYNISNAAITLLHEGGHTEKCSMEFHTPTGKGDCANSYDQQP